MFAPTKGKARALTKLKENIAEKKAAKFLLSSLKDLSRACIIFQTAELLVK